MLRTLRDTATLLRRHGLVLRAPTTHTITKANEDTPR